MTEIKNEISVRSEAGFLQVAKNFVSGDNGIAVAPDYDVNGAVKYLYLQVLDLKDKTGRPAIEVITQRSIEKSVRDMVAKGLNPMKKQCYPIVYGKDLQIQQSYQGAKRSAYSANQDIVKGSIRSQVIYKNDVFEDKIMPDGRRELVKHTQPSFDKRSEEIIGAYAMVTYKGGKTDMDVMTIAEINRAWAQSKTGGGVHKSFPHEMACKTVESRFAKKLYSSTDESVDEANDHFKKLAEESQDIEYDIMEESPLVVDAEEVDESTNDEMPEFESEEEFDELPDLPTLESEEPSDNAPIQIRYSEWANNYATTGEWEQVKGTYDKAKKTVCIRRKG